MARARYDELLAVAERWTIEAIRNPNPYAPALAAGWRAIHTAAGHHFAWLGHSLPAPPAAPQIDVDPDPALANAAAAIGAAGDLLATHEGRTAAVREDPAAAADARRTLAVVVLNASYAARSALEDARGRGTTQMRTIRDQIDRARSAIGPVLRHGAPAGELPPGTIARLTTSLPAPGSDLPSAIATAAARWSHLHHEHGSEGVVSGDLRAVTAQQRTTNAMTAHLVGGLIATAGDHELPGGRVEDLVRLQDALYRADRALLGVHKQWRNYASSAPTQSTHPAVDAHEVLAGYLRALVRPDGNQLVRGHDLVPDRAAARGLLGAVDDVTQALAEVASQQASIAAQLVRDRDLFVSPIARGGRIGRLSWTRPYNPEHAASLLKALDQVVPLAAAGADLARSAAGTLNEIRAQAAGATAAVPPTGRPRPPGRPRTTRPAPDHDTDGLESAIAYAGFLASEAVRAAASLEQVATALRDGGVGPASIAAIDSARDHLTAASEAMEAASSDLEQHRAVADAYRATGNQAGSRDFLTRE